MGLDYSEARVGPAGGVGGWVQHVVERGRCLIAALGPRGLVVAAIAAMPAVILAVAGYAQRWVTDDAFIDFRIVANLLAGHGPVFNLGERIEAYTNPLWVLLLTAWGAFGGGLEYGSVWLGLGLAVAGIVFGQAAAARLSVLVREPANLGLALPIGALAFVAIPAVWQFATSGMETGLTIGWMGISFWLVARLIGRGAPLWQWLTTAVVAGLGLLIRPDLAPFCVAWTLTLVVAAPAVALLRRRVILGLGLMLAAMALPVAYQIFRMGYFAALVPNTALAKEAGLDNWIQGAAYVQDFLGSYELVGPLMLLLCWLVGLAVVAYRARQRVVALLLLATLAAAVTHAVGIVRIGGDFMHARLLLPSLFGLLLPILTIHLPTTRHRRATMWAWGGLVLPVLVWAIACAAWFRVPYPAGQHIGIGDEHGYYTQLAGRPNPITIGDYGQGLFVRDGLRLLRRADRVEADGHDRILLVDRSDDDPHIYRLLPERTYAVAPWVDERAELVTGQTAMGMIGYLVDRFGLADPIASRLVLDQRGRPGHEKWLLNAWIIARFGAEPAGGEDDSVAAARRALACGDLATLHRAVTEPMTASRFLENARLAGRLTSLRVPSDPSAAEQHFCHPGSR